MKKLEITDTRFKVNILESSRQVDNEKLVWEFMHQCFSDGSQKSLEMKSRDPVASVIKNALKFGHWDVLCPASIALQFHGFPHSVAMQFRTHRRMNTLCQSMRYTGDRFIACADGKEDVADLFYLRVPSDEGWAHCYQSCVAYRDAIAKGEDKESARDLLASGYRQGFSVSGNFKEWMHLLDRRLLADTQLESRIAAQVALDLLCNYSEFFVWYEDRRAGKNQLAP